MLFNAQVSNRDVIGSTALVDIFSHDFWGQDIKLGDSHKSYRPLTTLTFRFDHLIHGLRAVGYHFTNIFLFALNCILVYVLSNQMLANETGYNLYFLNKLYLFLALNISRIILHRRNHRVVDVHISRHSCRGCR